MLENETENAEAAQASVQGNGPVLTHYAISEERYDELLTAPGEPRAHWQPLYDTLRNTNASELSSRIASAERQIRDSGITYNVYTDPDGLDRQWELDVLPFMVSAEEWRALEEGIKQRAKLLNMILADLYGPQQLLKEGLL